MKEFIRDDLLYKAGRSGHGAFAINMEFAYEYYVFVHRKDYELASALVNRNQ